MWRVLIQLPTLISECIGHLRTLSYLQQQHCLLQQETNLLLREMIVKITTQAVETPEAVRLDESLANPIQPPLVDLGKIRRAASGVDREKPRRILTERDIIRNTPTSIAEEIFRQEGLKQYPHRVGEQLPTSPHQTPTPATRPFGGPPGA